MLLQTWILINMDPLIGNPYVYQSFNTTDTEGRGGGKSKANNTTRAVCNYGENRLPAPVNIKLSLMFVKATMYFSVIIICLFMSNMSEYNACCFWVVHRRVGTPWLFMRVQSNYDLELHVAMRTFSRQILTHHLRVLTSWGHIVARTSDHMSIIKA